MEASPEGLPGPPLVGAHLGVDVLHDLLGPGLGGFVGQGELPLELLLKLKKKRLLRLLAPEAPPLQGLPQAEDRVLGPPGFLFLFAAVAGGVVGGGVGGEAVGEGLEEGGALPFLALSTAFLARRYTAKASFPSTTTPGIPYPSARLAT